MTKKDYVAIAFILQKAKHVDAVVQREYIIFALCHLFENDNSRFNAEKFRKACDAD